MVLIVKILERSQGAGAVKSAYINPSNTLTIDRPEIWARRYLFTGVDPGDPTAHWKVTAKSEHFPGYTSYHSAFDEASTNARRLRETGAENVMVSPYKIKE